MASGGGKGKTLNRFVDGITLIRVVHGGTLSGQEAEELFIGTPHRKLHGGEPRWLPMNRGQRADPKHATLHKLWVAAKHPSHVLPGPVLYDANKPCLDFLIGHRSVSDSGTR